MPGDNEILSCFIQGQLLTALIIGIMETVALAIIGVKYSPILGFIVEFQYNTLLWAFYRGNPFCGRGPYRFAGESFLDGGCLFGYPADRQRFYFA